MSSIAEALVATAVGLFVAIPAVAAFNYFQRRIATIMARSEALTNVVLAHLNAEAPPGTANVEVRPAARRVELMAASSDGGNGRTPSAASTSPHWSTSRWCC